MNGTILILALVLSYLAGGVPFGPLIARWKKVDLRAVGSGNVGATNVYRALGLKWAVTVFAADALKGLVPVLILRFVFPQSPAFLVAGVLAAAGHVFSPFLRFRGGKGVATGFGAMLGISPFAALCSLGLWLVMMRFRRVVSLASLIAAALLPLFTLAWAWEQPPTDKWPAVAAAGLIVGLVVWSHRENIRRIVRGEEKAIVRPRGNE